MAARISYGIYFENLDQSIVKLTILNRLLVNIGNNASKVGTGAAVGAAGAASVGSGTNVAGTAAIVASLATINKNLGVLQSTLVRMQGLPPVLGRPFAYGTSFQREKLSIETPHMYRVPVIRKFPSIKSEGGNILETLQSKGWVISHVGETLSGLQTQVKKSIFDPKSEWSKGLKTAYGIVPPAGSSMGAGIIPPDFKKEGLMTWLLPQGGSNTGVPPILKEMGKSGGLGNLFKKIFGGRELGHLARAAGLGGEGSIIFRLIGRFGTLGLAIGGVIASLIAFRNGIKEATEAYRTAAKQGLDVSTAYQLNKAFAAIGMSTPNLQNIAPMLRASGNNSEVILNAAKGGQLGEEGQQLVNMADEFRDAMKQGATAAAAMQMAAKTNSLIATEFSGVWTNIKSLFSTLTAQWSPEIHATLEVLNNFSEGLVAANMAALQFEIGIVNFLNNHLPKFAQISLPTGGNFQQTYFGKSGNATATSLEKLGFVMHGASPEKHLATIADNSTKTVSYLSKIAGALTGGGLVMESSLIHMPQLP